MEAYSCQQNSSVRPNNFVDALGGDQEHIANHCVEGTGDEHPYAKYTYWVDFALTDHVVSV